MDDKTVLLVDDDEYVLNAIGRALHKEPYQLVTAGNGREAMDIMSRTPINVVLTDIKMAEMGGLEFLSETKRSYPDVIRLVISGSSNSETILDAMNCGDIYRYIVKPWNDMELRILIKQAMDIYGLNEEKKLLIKTLQETNQHLEKQVAEQAKEVLDAMSMAMIGKYTAQIVHNLNNTLNGLSGIFFMISEELKEPDINKKELVHYCSEGNVCTEKMHGIIKGILDRARSRKNLEIENIDINKLIREEDAFFNYDEVYKYSITRKMNLMENLPVLIGNSSQIKQILDNLIKNAIDAMEHSPVKALTFDTSCRNDHIVITVTDTGEGIEKEALPRIFDSEFTTKPAGKGTGLGLASVRSMVEAYGGDIRVISEKGSGTTFIITLPVSQNPAC